MESTSLAMVIVQGFSKGSSPRRCWNPRQVLQWGMQVTGDHVTRHAMTVGEVEGTSQSGQNQIGMGRHWADSSNCGALCEVCMRGCLRVSCGPARVLSLDTHVGCHTHDCHVFSMNCPSKEA